MKYLKKISTNNYENTLFSNDKNNVNIILQSENNKICYEDYDFYIKFINKSKLQWITEYDMVDSNGNYNYRIAIDGVPYTYEEICNLYETLNLGLTESQRENYKGMYLSGRILFPFETTGEEHILSYKLTTTNETLRNQINGVGLYGYSITEVNIIKNSFLITKSSISSSSNLKYYLNNLREEQGSENTIGNFFQNTVMSWSKVEKIYLPKELKKIPDYCGYYTSIDKLNLNELTELEEIGEGCYFKNESEDEKILDLSFLTKLKKIGAETFNGITNVKQLILPPNIEILEDLSFRNISFVNNPIIEIPESIKQMAGAFKYCTGDYTIKFKSSIPPVSYDNTTYNALSVLYNSIFIDGNNTNRCILVPRGSKKAYFYALFCSQGDDVDEMYEFYSSGQNAAYAAWLEKIIEYDPE